MCKRFGDHNVGAMTRRILKRFDAATEKQIRQGCSWYVEAQTFAAFLAQDSPYTLEQIASVIAVLSPQCDWEQNKLATVRAVASHATGSRTLDRYPGYSANAAKAFTALDGDVSVVRGPKVTVFRDAILGDLSGVVVDIHATRAARSKLENLARVFRDDEAPGRVEMRAIQEGYRRAALARGLAPSECQAVTWLVVKSSGDFVRPQHMPGGQAERFYARHLAARQRLGLTIHTREGYWGQSRKGLAAALEVA